MKIGKALLSVWIAGVLFGYLAVAADVPDQRLPVLPGFVLAVVLFFA